MALRILSIRIMSDTSHHRRISIAIGHLSTDAIVRRRQSQAAIWAFPCEQQEGGSITYGVMPTEQWAVDCRNRHVFLLRKTRVFVPVSMSLTWWLTHNSDNRSPAPWELPLPVRHVLNEAAGIVVIPILLQRWRHKEKGERQARMTSEQWAWGF